MSSFGCSTAMPTATGIASVPPLGDLERARRERRLHALRHALRALRRRVLQHHRELVAGPPAR